MKRWLAVSHLAALLLIPPAQARAADPPSIDDLAWMAGCWEGNGGGGANRECWTAPGGGIMLGVSRVIHATGTEFEFLRLAPHGDGLAMLPQPGGKPSVAFPLVEHQPNRAVFANPEHDFPQRISYLREGEGMRAKVEAKRGEGEESEWVGFEIVWRLDPAGWAGGGSPSATGDGASDEVRAVETAFAQTMADRDHDAFTAFLADEAVFVSSQTARGGEAVATQWKRYFDDPEPPFSWQPDTVEVLASGGLALSSGPVHAADGTLISRFTSVWRREPSGWRVVFDKGQRVCPE